MKIKSFILTLYDPPKIAFFDKRLGSENLVLDGKMLSLPYFPLWAACADLLVNSLTNELVGLTYLADEGGQIAQSLVKELSARVVRYVKADSGKNAALYAKYNLTPDHFEIRWSDSPADCIESAQLSSDYWYYEEKATPFPKFRALGLSDIDEILDDYKLKLPADIALEPCKPLFAGIH